MEIKKYYRHHREQAHVRKNMQFLSIVFCGYKSFNWPGAHSAAQTGWPVSPDICLPLPLSTRITNTTLHFSFSSPCVLGIKLR